MIAHPLTEIEYRFVGPEWQAPIAQIFDAVVAAHLHFNDGFTVAAIQMNRGEPVGVLAVKWQRLTPPLAHLREAYIDVIEVCPEFRRQGVASQIVALAAGRAKKEGCCQLRAWSAETKTEAIPMWARLGFGLTPAVIHPDGQAVRGYYATKPIK